MSETTAHTHSRPYGRIFLSLFVLTVFEIAISNLHFARPVIIFTLVFLAFVKAALVAMFYMHLRFEKIFLTITLVGPLIFTLIFVLGIGHDLVSLASKYLH